MHWLKFDGLLREQGWLEPAFVALDERGHIVALRDRPGEELAEMIAGYAIPGFQNAHSHAFQYAMAGSAEKSRSDSDDFWSWRESMYDLALKLTPEDVEAIAAMLYAEMLRHGYTDVAEFHYLHHGPDGARYDPIDTMAGAIMNAAQLAGIGLMLVPIFYQNADFGQPALPEQRRFLSPSLDVYWELWHAAAKRAERQNRCRVGVGIHSLRAVAEAGVREVFATAPRRLPLHLHIAEQTREVERALEHWGRRPVAWLLDEVEVNERCHLVHATHIERAEMEGIVRSGANVVICPSTEGNLGDGFFPLEAFHLAGGCWSIGSDSHIGLSPMEELRWLDYGGRMRRRKRNILCPAVGEDSGHGAFHRSLIGGRRAMGLARTAYFGVGQPFDAVILARDFPPLAGKPSGQRLSTLIYAGDASAIAGTMVAGQWVVRRGRHQHEASIRESFFRTMNGLRNR